MPELHDAAAFLALSDKGFPLLDARSPSEYGRGHIPGALNLPVLSDEERVTVGTIHARGGSEAAARAGLELVGPQLTAKLSLAVKLTGKRREVLLHCWRGGMRSSCMAWLLETGGFRVHLLRGGYKAYRALVREELARPTNILLLSGMTGCGKTDILKQLAARGKQVIDLEELAGHRGSAFGGVGLKKEQPRNEQVENLIHARLRAFDPSRPVWMEDEDRHIGTVTLADPLFRRMRASALVVVDLPLNQRLIRLVSMYTDHSDTEELVQALGRLEKRLGGKACAECANAIREGRHADAATRLLAYYDKAYTHQIEAREGNVIRRLRLETDNPQTAARRLEILENELAALAAQKGLFKKNQ